MIRIQLLTELVGDDLEPGMEFPRAKADLWHWGYEAIFLNPARGVWVAHDLGNTIVGQEGFDGAKKRKDDVEAHRSEWAIFSGSKPMASCSNQFMVFGKKSGLRKQ